MPLNLRTIGKAMVESELSAALIVADADLRVTLAAGAALPDHGYRPEECVGRAIDDVLRPDAWAQLGPRYSAALAGEHQAFDYWTADGRSAYWVQISPVWGDDGAVDSTVAVMHDITERLRRSAELARGEARLRETERMIGVGSWELVLEDGTITYSPGFAAVIGLVRGGPLDLETYKTMVHEEDRESLAAAVAACVSDGSVVCDYRVVRPDGAVRQLTLQGQTVPGDGSPARYLRGAILDVTEQRELERQRIAALSLFEQGFDAAPIGMALTDPADGHYLRVNDALCRLLGRSRDELLGLSVADVTHPEDRGHDEEARYAMLLGNMGGYQAQKRYTRPDGSVVWADLHVAPVRNAEGTVEAFFAQKIDITEAKEREAQLAQYVSDAEWLGRIRDALDNDRMMLYWQPIVDLRTGETVQRELLLRMRDEGGTIITPGVFLPVAERYGLISEIDRWVIRRAVRLAADGTPVEFNLSAASIGDPDILRELALEIEATGADPGLLVVEVTETAMMDQTAAGQAFAEQLRAMGCRLALDDFGTGFASLSYLKYLHAEHLKIDMEFVRDLMSSEDDERVVRGIVGLAREFEQTTTAEGIEDEQTVAKLRELGVDRGQGYLFARPAPLDHAESAKKVVSRPAPASGDPVAMVRAAFRAFADRDLEAVCRLCHPQSVLRPYATSKRAHRDGGYRGHAGLKQYFQDVGDVWDDLRLTPTAFWEANDAVLVFGRAVASAEGYSTTAETLWVYRMRDGLIASVDVFKHPGEGTAPVTVTSRNGNTAAP